VFHENIFPFALTYDSAQSPENFAAVEASPSAEIDDGCEYLSSGANFNEARMLNNIASLQTPALPNSAEPSTGPVVATEQMA